MGGHEAIGPDLAAAETMFLGLRLLDGLDLAQASARLGIDLADKYRPQIEELLELGLLERQGSLLRLSEPALPDRQPGIYAIFGLRRRSARLTAILKAQ